MLWEFAFKLTESANDEMGRLVHSYNPMVAYLEKSAEYVKLNHTKYQETEELKKYRNRLENIVMQRSIEQKGVAAALQEDIAKQSRQIRNVDTLIQNNLTGVVVGLTMRVCFEFWGAHF